MFDFMFDPDTLYQALLNRDPAYEGRALVGVATTGIFCRLTCPARKPRPENCRWFSNAAEAAAAGFRPCQRCHPTGPEAEGDAVVQALLPLLGGEIRWTESELAARGFDPSTVRRAFRRHFGVTFLELARQARLRDGVRRLGQGGPVIEAQLDAGFDSASGFRSAFARLFGHPPAAMRAGGLQADWLETPLGGMIAVADDHALHLLEFTDRKALARQLAKVSKAAKGQISIGRNATLDRLEAELAAYFAGHPAPFSLPLETGGTAFQRRVWDALRLIPAGETRSYADLAQALRQPSAVRAVAGANGANRIALVIPCHRVIGKDGSMTGYAGGLWRKQKLIELERGMQESA
ncbi:MAG: trifunctional transcriptional activator/DNA repair protein Ada/methylated-DNA--[protein]-cysteine S-methyltransferase [Paracoccus sp. (in: a-proteobacteria)]|uniref:bifunctional transcriptional activator/DNA repair enzyme AdaA n=1 Tax=Paracoccus sp. TaxID=267 RepID=UPI0026DFDDCE|nr:trifunctional transcriptional activator/DNA repair protein Ada/methylated-DNA--[protein]-cysteine S-methyltransferase [Paracoccus sp. (in: a-proteobacteria)]MDO5620464.1 trifunctional transcriptional activator/DNA repair protein Ada/methylated-DNA--[protein]-cysteine S-methyltransferase [Paracoccus sp. (in: a-proteobacteria)]